MNHSLEPDINSTLYLSGPMGDGALSVLLFKRITSILTDAGYTIVFDPSSISYTDERFSGKPSNGFREQLNHLTTADTVIFFGEWENARGCIAELFNAVLFGCNLFTLNIDPNGDIEFAALEVNHSNVSTIVSELLGKQQAAHL
jgi:hypothetical protein